MEPAPSQDVEVMFDRQDTALRLLTHLRQRQFPTVNNVVQTSNQRRQYRRWAAPDSIAVSVYVDDWQSLDVIDVGIGGIKVTRNDHVPSIGPFVCKLGIGGLTNVFVIADIMWMSDHTVGIRFEFDKLDEHDLWAEHLVDTLLSKLSI